MRHHRSPTLSYPHNTAPLGHAPLALRPPAIPTLLSPLSNTDHIDDLQSNAWLSHRPLAGLGITYVRDPSTNLEEPFVPEVSALRLRINHDEGTAEDRRADILDSFSSFGGFDDRPLANFAPFLDDDPSGHSRFSLDDDIDSPAGDIVGLIPDVNMFDNRRLDLPRPGVNPMDTIRSSPLCDIAPPCEEFISPMPEDYHIDDFLSPTDSRAEQSPSPRVIQDILSILVQPTPPRPWSSSNLPSTQCFSPSHPAALRLSLSAKVDQACESGHYSLPVPGSAEYSNASCSPPILNAHLGIELDELISKAERFRTKHPERDIDRAWLSHFAGKLSNRGELLDDFRCYVIGCDQQNKRRDHILVHVGAHIGQRPFACSLCPLRFLRKNECKRHEASHSGFRPYSCDICGQSFVRQDLVKRHAKRTHGTRDENQKQSTRKKARLG